MKISVCIPVYKVAPYIERCARSLFAQTYADMEYIFVDDCSPDESIAILWKTVADYPSRVSQVKVVRHERNAGLIRSRRTALEHVTGELVVHCDSDDWVDADLYAKMAAKFDDPEVDMVFAPMLRNADGHFKGIPDLDFRGTPTDYLSRVGEIVAFNSTVNKMYRRSVACADDLELPDSVTIAEDMCRTVQSLAKCRLVTSVTGSAYHYFVNTASMSRAFDGRKAIDSLTAVYDVLCRRVPSAMWTRLRKQVVRDVAFHGLKFGVMGPDEFARWRGELQALADVPWPPDTTLKRRALLAIAVRSYPLATWLMRHIPNRKVDGL